MLSEFYDHLFNALEYPNLSVSELRRLQKNIDCVYDVIKDDFEVHLYGFLYNHNIAKEIEKSEYVAYTFARAGVSQDDLLNDLKNGEMDFDSVCLCFFALTKRLIQETINKELALARDKFVGHCKSRTEEYFNNYYKSFQAVHERSKAPTFISDYVDSLKMILDGNTNNVRYFPEYEVVSSDSIMEDAITLTEAQNEKERFFDSNYYTAIKALREGKSIQGLIKDDFLIFDPLFDTYTRLSAIQLLYNKIKHDKKLIRMEKEDKIDADKLRFLFNTKDSNVNDLFTRLKESGFLGDFRSTPSEVLKSGGKSKLTIEPNCTQAVLYALVKLEKRGIWKSPPHYVKLFEAYFTSKTGSLGSENTIRNLMKKLREGPQMTKRLKTVEKIVDDIFI